jgi:hypothetical protein
MNHGSLFEEDETRRAPIGSGVSDGEAVSDHLRILKWIISGLLCVSMIAATFYAYRQRVWSDKLHAQLVQTNLDDVKLMKLLTVSEKESIARRFREQGEARIADWISKEIQK